MVDFPAPVGGTPLPQDFIPSIVFAGAYALLVPLMAYRMFSRRSRCLLLLGTTVFGVERIAIYSLRAVQSRNQAFLLNGGVFNYVQTSFGMGYIGIASDLVNIVRCLLVNPTYGSDRYPESPAAATKGGVMTAPPPGTPDMPKERFWIRQIMGSLVLFYFAALIPGIMAHTKFFDAQKDQKMADKVYTLRIVSTAVCLFLTLFLLSTLLWARRKLERMSHRGATVLTVLVSLISIMAIYRLYVMPIIMTDLFFPNTLNTTSGKALFYVFHCLPEWLCTVVLFSDNIRKTFGTGLLGDYRATDETPEGKEKRLKKEAKRAEKRGGHKAEYVALNRLNASNDSFVNDKDGKQLA